MKLLAIDTATEACSVALLLEGEVHERYEVAPRRHAALVLPMVEALLSEAGLTLAALDAIAFGRGPGAFTGVRIAAGVVQGLALGADLPVLPVSTLTALAEGARRETGAQRIAAAIDARMDEVYWSCVVWEGEEWRSVIAECVVPPAAVSLPPGDAWHGIGSGWEAYAEVLVPRFGGALSAWATALPRARDVAALGARDFVRGLARPAEQALPVYLRDRVVG